MNGFSSNQNLKPIPEAPRRLSSTTPHAELCLRASHHCARLREGHTQWPLWHRSAALLAPMVCFPGCYVCITRTRRRRAELELSRSSKPPPPLPPGFSLRRRRSFCPEQSWYHQPTGRKPPPSSLLRGGIVRPTLIRSYFIHFVFHPPMFHSSTFATFYFMISPL